VIRAPGLLLIVLLPGIALSGQSDTTSGPCSPIAPNNSGSITINCPGISKQQGEQILKLLNKIFAEKLDMNAVMSKLDEILHEVNPNAPKTTYTFDGVKRVVSPGRSLAVDDGTREIFNEIGRLEQTKDWARLIKLSETQMKERPEWFTPYIAAGEGNLRLGQRQKALELLEFAEKRIAGNPDYDPVRKPLSEMLREARGR
jgi:hypothetical protein